MAQILFVVSLNLSQEIIAGHFLSTLSLAGQLRKRGHRVGLVASLPFSFPELEQANIELYQAPYPAFVKRPIVIWKIFREQKYEAIVSMDVGAAWHAWLAAVAAGAPVIQVIPGGPTPRFPVIRLPGIMVFSQELYAGIPAGQGIPQDYLALSAGRIDFAFFEQEAQAANERDFGYVQGIPRLLIVSRLQTGKHEAVQALFEQVREAARTRAVQLAVIGDGDARARLEAQAAEIMAQSEGRAHIRFLGGFRVTPSDLKQADLVIGQGRTIVEALASGVPAAVCGAPGYFGLLTPKTLPIFAASNLTGRGINEPGNLLADLEHLDTHKTHEYEETRRMAFDLFDVSQGAKTIEGLIEKFLAEPVTPMTRGGRNAVGYLKTVVRSFAWAFDKTLRVAQSRLMNRRKNV